MRKQILIILLTVIVVIAGGVAGMAVTDGGDHKKLSSGQIVQQLLEGNTRFVKQQMTSLAGWGKASSSPVNTAAQPCAVILTCADAHIPPEILFDRGAGCLFVLRVAGNVVNPALLGSIELAVEQLGIPVVMVLGHERCGAVATAIVANGSAFGNSGALLKTIEPAVRQAERKISGGSVADLLELAVDLNAKMVADSLVERSLVLKNKAGQGKLKIVAAKLDSDDGKVVLLD